MTPNLTYIVVVGVLFAAGVTLLLERSLTRVLMGVILLGNGANLLLLTGGRAGGPPIVGTTDGAEMSDPLPQAMVLTAIVITLGMTAFLLALSYRSWHLNGHDEVQDDVEDRRIMDLADRDEGPGTDDADQPDSDDQLDGDGRPDPDSRRPSAASLAAAAGGRGREA
ncbi:Na(+)/H(+) antiporter subunit C [Micromonospora antibiotica]|uniref:Na(+)/H(+) antiporter subunit C n=1 Tax=Micromonospora antibiotica TaxID=2807623 RepID=A0ABS3V4B2_9ACTN|nr:Na(+)/H(+) antiporter subunit C [Micromonospora antibiotica]MBO4160439.1 Na(+)/H(+) antiporter subunit C [Micromonospora antibiotica]